MPPIDHILIIGFGGPTNSEEIHPFLKQVAQGRNIPEERLKIVAHHYEAIGGRSPYNEAVFRFAQLLRGNSELEFGIPPIFVGMRHWHPFLHETLSEIKRAGLRSGLGIILAPHRSIASCGRYKDNIDEARKQAQASEVEYRYLKPWFDRPLFIQAQAEQVRKVLEKVECPGRRENHLIFTAHSIPVAVLSQCDSCRYDQEFETSCRLIAKALGRSEWTLAYQSRSGNPRDPWLEPDILSVLRELKAKGEKEVIVVPLGFVCDNAEILYDLDREAKAEAERLGLRFLRVPTVIEHPKFVRLFCDLIYNECVIPACL